MADRHVFGEDVESAEALLRDEVKERASDGFFQSHSPSKHERRRSWGLFSHLLVCMLIAVVSFGLGRYSYASQVQDEKRSPIGRGMTPNSFFLIFFYSLFPFFPYKVADSNTSGIVPLKTTIFQPDPRYNDDPFGPDSLQSPWGNLTPLGRGHIRIDNPSTWNLSGGYPLTDDISNPHAEEYTLSVIHQLHCLATIKSKMSLLQDWYAGENDREYLRFSLGQEFIRDEHVYHCFDYLRQAIMCSGDITLEKARVEEGKVVRGVDGWGVEHVCRDWDVIFKWAEVHRSED